MLEDLVNKCFGDVLAYIRCIDVLRNALLVEDSLDCVILVAFFDPLSVRVGRCGCVGLERGRFVNFRNVAYSFERSRPD